MKVLTAVAHPQHPRETDFCFAEDGEIVVLNASLVCDNPACGCDRTAMGVKSRKGTTTLRVSDLEVTDDDITALLQDYNDKTWAGRLGMDVMRKWWTAATLIAENAPTGALLRVHADGEDWVVAIEPAAAA